MLENYKKMHTLAQIKKSIVIFDKALYYKKLKYNNPVFKIVALQ